MSEIRDSDIDRFYGEYERPIRGTIGQCAKCGEDINARDTYYTDGERSFCNVCANDEETIDCYVLDKFDIFDKQNILGLERIDN